MCPEAVIEVYRDDTEDTEVEPEPTEKAEPALIEEKA
jgi:hypothetical protein